MFVVAYFDGIALAFGKLCAIARNRIDGNGGMLLAIVGAFVAFGIHSQLCLRDRNGDRLPIPQEIILIAG